MDKKEEAILKHYKKKIESQEFDEYDLIAFLIVIRPHLNVRKHKRIKDFADTIAHRVRNQGIAKDAIQNAKKHGYVRTPKNNKVRGYRGIAESTWEREWRDFGKTYDIKITKKIIKDITLCFYSLSQFTTYFSDKKRDGKKGKIGKMDLSAGRDSKLALMTSENTSSSLYINFSVSGAFDLLPDRYKHFYDKPVEAVRDETGKLRLRDEDGFITA